MKKLKTPSPAKTVAGIRESAEQLWATGIGAFAKAQESGNKIFETLVKEGDALKKRTRQVAEEKVSGLAAQAGDAWGRVEQVVEQRVAQSIHSLGVPTRQDIEALEARVAELSRLVKAHQAGAKAPAAKAPRTARPAQSANPAKPTAKRSARKTPATRSTASKGAE